MPDPFIRGDAYFEMERVARDYREERDGVVSPLEIKEVLMEHIRITTSLRALPCVPLMNTISHIATAWGQQQPPEGETMPEDDQPYREGMARDLEKNRRFEAIEGGIPDGVPNDDVRFGVDPIDMSGEMSEEDFMNQFMSAPDGMQPMPPGQESMEIVAREQLRDFQEKIYDATIVYLRAKEHYDKIVADPENYTHEQLEAARERYAMAELTRSAATAGHPNILLGG